MANIKAALIGCGGRNRVHFDKLIEMGGVEFVGFCDVIEERAKAFSDRVGQGEVFTSYQELLAHTNPDVVYIAVPPHQHGDIENAVIDRSIPFMVEKPVALDIRVAEALEKRIQEKGLLVAAGFQDRYQNLTQIMKSYIADKQVGLVSASWFGGIPAVPWWRTMATSGGQIVEQNIHLFDQARYLFGEVESVYCAGAKGIVDPDAYGVPGYDVDDYSSAVLKFKNGVVANIFTGCYVRKGGGMQSGMNIYCADATLEYKLRNSLTIRDANGEQHFERGDEQTGIMDRAFIHAVRTGDTSGILADYSEAVKSLRLTLACNESIETGRAVRL
ncbi:MAG: Gfo/Idh/MocA family protein [Eubacteriales bacterium]